MLFTSPIDAEAPAACPLYIHGLKDIMHAQCAFVMSTLCTTMIMVGVLQ